MLYLGPHYSLSKNADTIETAVQSVIDMGGNAIQIFTGPPVSLTLGKIFDSPITKKTRDAVSSIPAFIHAKYMINFGKSPHVRKNYIFLKRYIQDLDISVQLGMRGVVLHFGTNSCKSGAETKHCAQINMIDSLVHCLDRCHKRAVPILETSSGEGNYIGKTIEDISFVYHNIPAPYQKRIKFCVDTCHIFVCGYPIHKKGGWTEYIREFEDQLGKKKIGVIHLNDSATPFGGRNDRHAELKKGYIFNAKMGGSVDALKEILDWASKNNVPCIIETHKNFKAQIALGRKLVGEKQSGGGVRIMQEQLAGIIDCFQALADYNQAQGNIHQYHAYHNAVLKLSREDSPADVDDIGKIEGFGEGLMGKIEEYVATGRMAKLEEMKKNKYLTQLIELTSVYGIGPIFAKKLIHAGITSIRKLMESRENLTDAQKYGLEYYDDLRIKIQRKTVERVVAYLRKVVGAEIEIMGGYRLGKKYSHDIDILVVGEDVSIANIIDKLRKNTVAVIEAGERMAILFARFPCCKHVVHLDIRISDEKMRAFYTLYFGSGENFSRKIRKIAKEQGYTLSEHGFRKNGKYIAGDFSTERKIFDFLKVPYVEPKDRL
jgi:apurinic endonuclease APN1